jgi:Domain of unknown function (DUF4157)
MMSTFAPRQEQVQQPASLHPSQSNRLTIRPLRPASLLPPPGWDKTIPQDEIRPGTQVTAHVSQGFDQIPIHSSVPGLVQAKLEISSPDDIYEQEADRMSDLALRMAEPRSQYGGADDPENSGWQMGQPRHASHGGEGLPSSGHPLEAAARSFLEPRLGFDFSRVRIHDDASAAESAGRVHALAYTVGRDIVFARDRYQPGSGEGRRLLAHELTHVVQQGAAFPLSSAAGRHLNAPAHLLQRRTSPTTSPIPFSDAQVQKIIDDTLKSHSNDVFASAAYLNVERDKPANQGDENMAAAEHYFYARAAGSMGFNAPNGVLAYAFLKKIGIKVPLGSGPVTPTSAGQIKWGLRGATDGYKDLLNKVLSL